MKKNNTAVIATALLFAIAAICGFFFFSEYRTAQKESAEYMEIQGRYTTVLTESTQSNRHSDHKAIPQTASLPYVITDFDLLLQTNPETVGWLAIPGTNISYPVVQADDNSKYLHTSFNGERSKAGAAFMDCNNTAHPLDRNTIIYGHNLGVGRAQEMFGPLLQYRDQEYFNTHQYIQFDTAHRQYGWWRVFAVIHLDVTASPFDYLKQNFQNAAEFEAWIAQAKALSLYDTGADVPADAPVLTLSTCNRANGFGRNGRQLVLAVWCGE